MTGPSFDHTSGTNDFFDYSFSPFEQMNERTTHLEDVLRPHNRVIAMFHERILPGESRKLFDWLLRRFNLINGNVFGDFTLREFATLGNKQMEGLTFSSLLPSDIPNNMFRAWRWILTRLRKRFSRSLILVITSLTRARIPPFIRTSSDVSQNTVNRVCTITRRKHQIATMSVSVHGSILFCCFYAIQIFWRRDKRIREVARCGAARLVFTNH